MAERTKDVIAYWLSLGLDYIPGVEDLSVSDAINGGFLRVFLLQDRSLARRSFLTLKIILLLSLCGEIYPTLTHSPMGLDSS